MNPDKELAKERVSLDTLAEARTAIFRVLHTSGLDCVAQNRLARLSGVARDLAEIGSRFAPLLTNVNGHQLAQVALDWALRYYNNEIQAGRTLDGTPYGPYLPRTIEQFYLERKEQYNVQK